MGLESLKERRVVHDMVQTFKILKGMDKLTPEKIFELRQLDIHTRRGED